MDSESSISGSIDLFSKHNAQQIDELIRQGRSTEALQHIEKILRIDKDNLVILKLGYRASSNARDWDMAIRYIDNVIRLAPNNDIHKKRKIQLLANNKNFKDAINLAESLGDTIYEEPIYLDALKVCHYQLGDTDKAKEIGQMSLSAKDKDACSAIIDTGYITRHRGTKNVISYSLWGKTESYQIGAMINSVLARYIYPEWICRYYVNSEIRIEVLDFLVKAGCEVVNMDNSWIPGYFWRFLVLSDPSVNMFICRDCDCRLGTDEYLLVREWQNSGKSFHVIRDHILHNDLILAGLWGGFSTPSMDIESLMREFFNGKPSNEYHADQIFLERSVWPRIREDVLIHDSNYNLDNIDTKKPKDKSIDHIGCGYIGNDLLANEQNLYNMPKLIDKSNQ